ncbi:MAG: hypothetical protein VXW87_05060 [Pseudomonadota bacterium]|nr:hypothetical protein [Pseudomonadota bacterium]
MNKNKRDENLQVFEAQQLLHKISETCERVVARTQDPVFKEAYSVIKQAELMTSGLLKQEF